MDITQFKYSIKHCANETFKNTDYTWIYIILRDLAYENKLSYKELDNLKKSLIGD